MIRQWWIGAAVICLLASGALAREGKIKTKEGRVLQGDVDEGSPDGLAVSVTIHGATITVPKSDVVSIDYAADDGRAFPQQLSKLDPHDVAGRIDLGNQELRNGNYDNATLAAKDALRIDPHDPDAKLLLDTIASEQSLAAKSAAAPPPPPVSNNSPAAAPTTAPAPADAGKYLSDDDIQSIRRNELLAKDEVRIQFYNKVRQRYLAATGIDSAVYNSETSTEQAMDIFETGDPKLWTDVKIGSDPKVLSVYRARIQPGLLSACAGCHGGTQAAGGFYLYSDADKPAPAYTNFYILTQTSRKITGTDVYGSGPALRWMIDRVHVDSSLLLQFGLPRSVATIPHPAVAGFKPMFQSTEDGSYVEVSKWIASLKPLAPDYGIHFTIPAGNPATQPSTSTGANPG